MQREERRCEARLVDPIALITQSQCNAIANAGHAQCAVIGETPAVKKPSRALSGRRDRREFRERPLDVL